MSRHTTRVPAAGSESRSKRRFQHWARGEGGVEGEASLSLFCCVSFPLPCPWADVTHSHKMALASGPNSGFRSPFHHALAVRHGDGSAQPLCSPVCPSVRHDGS